MKRMIRKWFTAQTMEQLKAEYKTLIKQHHPDLGGTEEAMAEINAEYDWLAEQLPMTNSKGETYQPKPETREAPEAFRAAVMATLHMMGVEVELCGNWLWATGNTKAYKDQLKDAGYKWSANKSAWYWHPEGYHKHGKKKFTLDEIRFRFGSERVTASAANSEALPA